MEKIAARMSDIKVTDGLWLESTRWTASINLMPNALRHHLRCKACRESRAHAHEDYPKCDDEDRQAHRRWSIRRSAGRSATARCISIR